MSMCFIVSVKKAQNLTWKTWIFFGVSHKMFERYELRAQNFSIFLSFLVGAGS